MFENTPVSPAPTTHRRRMPRWAIFAILAGALILLCCIGGGIYAALGGGSDPKPGPTFHDPTTASPTAPTPSATRPNPPPTSPTVVPASPRPEAATIATGEWQAGTDFPAGTYETTTTSDHCVWQVTTGQAPDVKYVDPGHIGPGHYRFTFRAGQTLHTTDCGTWTKVG